MKINTWNLFEIGNTSIRGLFRVFYFCSKSFIIDVWLSYVQASEDIEIFKVKVRWSKSSQLLQRIAFLIHVCIYDLSNREYQNNIVSKSATCFICPSKSVIKIVKNATWKMLPWQSPLTIFKRFGWFSRKSKVKNVISKNVTGQGSEDIYFYNIRCEN